MIRAFVLRPPWNIAAVLLPALMMSGCDDGVAPDNGVPVVSSIVISSNSTNVLAAEVAVKASGGVTAHVEYRESSGGIRKTPPTPLASNEAVIDVLGLRPETEYEFEVFVTGSTGASAAGSPRLFRTGSLPADLPAVKVASSLAPSPGYVMMGISPSQPSEKTYAMIVDNGGNVVWYRKFTAAVADFQKQNGHYTVYSSLDGNASRFYELDPGGRVVQEMTADDPANTDAHELRIVNGDYYLFGVELRTMDLTAIGGLSDATVRGMTIEQHHGASTVFQWSTFDHFEVSDAAPDIPTTGAQVNPWHGNALEIEADGNILASFRNADVIAKINGTTGNVIWRLGGKHNDFVFLNDPLNGFSHQHGIRRLPNGHVILFDNGNLHTPPVSRAVEYALDETAMTATLVWEYRGAPGLYSFAVGNAQRMDNGNTLICFGLAQHVVEVDMNGTKQWDLVIDEPNHYPYRAFRIDSLY